MSNSLFLFTAGTSLFENLKDPGKFPSHLLDQQIVDYEKKGAGTPLIRRAGTSHNRVEFQRFARLFAPLDLANKKKRSRSTAEIAAFSLHQPAPTARVVLLCSDTYAGVFAAFVNGLLLADKVQYLDANEKGHALDGFSQEEISFHPTLANSRIPLIEISVVKGLDPRLETLMEKALPNLIDKIADFHFRRGWDRRDDQPTVINYTGGLKAMIPTLTQIAAVDQTMRLVCLHEEGSTLIEQPLIPIKIEDKAAERLLWAGKGDPDHADPLVNTTRDSLAREEWAFYQEQPPKPLQLTDFGQAMKTFLHYREEARKAAEQ